MDGHSMDHLTWTHAMPPGSLADGTVRKRSRSRVNRQAQDTAPSLEAVAARLPARVGEVLAGLLSDPLAPGLYVVSTPIGNLADTSLRALAVLARAGLVFCEDTRHTRKLLAHFGIRADLHAYHDHNAARERPRILARLRAGFSVALVADAGTPLISDPGYKLVRDALDQGLKVTSVPGPTAAVAALTTAGLPTAHFHFEGFLPTKPGARRRRLEALTCVPATLVFYEAPSRLQTALQDMAAALGARDGAVVKELTKRHETVVRGPLDTLAERLAGETAAKGEFVVLAGPPPAVEVSDRAIGDALAAAQAGQSLRDAVREVAGQLGVARSRVYRIGLAAGESDD